MELRTTAIFPFEGVDIDACHPSKVEHTVAHFDRMAKEYAEFDGPISEWEKRCVAQAVATLKQRFSRGEISKDRFITIARDLSLPDAQVKSTLASFGIH
jgi:hypothetical protein